MMLSQFVPRQVVERTDNATIMARRFLVVLLSCLGAARSPVTAATRVPWKRTI
jgi:hypothetical protein